MRIVCRRAIVKGMVQGVGFRATTLREATRIGGLQGWVRNLASGDVEILVQGEEAQVTQLLEWARTGPSTGRVDKLQDEAAPVDPALGAFGIRK